MTSWQELADSAASCTPCDLYKRATETVFGEGPVDAALVLVGETPGDQEDKHGRPFVGPGGRVLDRALADSGIARKDVYLTNAVKHFKWTARGKRRIHQRPNGTEIKACEFWLEAELGVDKAATGGAARRGRGRGDVRLALPGRRAQGQGRGRVSRLVARAGRQHHPPVGRAARPGRIKPRPRLRGLGRGPGDGARGGLRSEPLS